MKIAKLNNKGFTIVELLIVIVIIGILATIGFVAFSGAQNKANKSTAQSTLSQVKSKLGEYYATNNTYPSDKAAVSTFLTSEEGGRNEDLNTKFSNAAYSYVCNDEEDGGCDGGFTITAAGSLWGKSGETETVRN
jgi:type IV pilus assembly protein PilE